MLADPLALDHIEDFIDYCDDRRCWESKVSADGYDPLDRLRYCLDTLLDRVLPAMVLQLCAAKDTPLLRYLVLQSGSDPDWRLTWETRISAEHEIDEPDSHARYWAVLHGIIDIVGAENLRALLRLQRDRLTLAQRILHE